MRFRHAHAPEVVHSVTTMGPSLADDSDRRMKQYLWTMGVRTTCFFLAVAIDSWVRWLFALGAVVLPYFAVVIANAMGPRWGARISGVDKYAAGPSLTMPPPPRGLGPRPDRPER